MSIENPLSPNSFVGTTLELQNDGYISIYQIKLLCTFEDFATEDSKLKIKGIAFCDKQITPRLSPGEKTTLDLRKIVTAPAQIGSIIKVTIQYRMLLIPRQFEKNQYYIEGVE